MTEQNNDQVPEPDRYSVEYIELSEVEAGGASDTLQNALNEGSKKSQKLIGVATDPADKGVLLFWDTEGMVSG